RVSDQRASAGKAEQARGLVVYEHEGVVKDVVSGDERQSECLPLPDVLEVRGVLRVELDHSFPDRLQSFEVVCVDLDGTDFRRKRRLRYVITNGQNVEDVGLSTQEQRQQPAEELRGRSVAKLPCDAVQH